MSFRPLDIDYLVIEMAGRPMQGHASRLSGPDTVDALVERLRTKYREETSKTARLSHRMILLRRAMVETAELTSFRADGSQISLSNIEAQHGPSRVNVAFRKRDDDLTEAFNRSSGRYSPSVLVSYF